MPRRFPAPWTVEQIPGGYKVVDATGQALAYCYARETKAQADIAKVLTMDEARRIAANIAKMPTLLEKKREQKNVPGLGTILGELLYLVRERMFLCIHQKLFKTSDKLVALSDMSPLNLEVGQLRSNVGVSRRGRSCLALVRAFETGGNMIAQFL